MSDSGNGFAQKALIILSGVLVSGLLAFFVWLALAVVEIRINVAEMKATIASLVETRRQERQPPTDERRIEELEKDQRR